MKTKDLVMAMAVLAMTGCSQIEVTDVNPDIHPEIGFDVYTGVQTKGKETTTDALKVDNAGFGILAYKTSNNGWDKDKTSTAPQFMYNEHATWNTINKSSCSRWIYENFPKFWPTNDDKITFFAYAPYEASPTNGTNKKIILSGQEKKGAPELTFEVNTGNDCKDMVDLVTDGRSAIKNQTATTNSINNGVVSFKFSHVLTKIANIKVKPDVDLGNNTKIFVTGLKLSPGNILYSKAVYQFDNDEWVATTSNATYFSEDLDLSAFLNNQAQSQWGYSSNSVDVSNHDTNIATLFPDGQALYFIPVNNATGTTSVGDLKLKINYDIVTMVDKDNNLTSTVKDKEISLPAGTFKKGTAHTYTLTIKMNAIKIEVEEGITGWDTSSGDEAVNVK